MKVGIMTSDYDTSISEDELLSLSDEDLAWFKDECSLSHEDLFRILVWAKKIVRELKSNDELLDLTYDTGGAWYIHVDRSDTKGCWHISVRREDQSLVRQQADLDVVK
jgi:hypothetical protein